jgi:hypothetical protein
LAVEDNHPKKTGGGKRCCGILSPFQISWKTEKDGQPNRPAAPENRCLFSPARGLKMGTSSFRAQVLWTYSTKPNMASTVESEFFSRRLFTKAKVFEPFRD